MKSIAVVLSSAIAMVAGNAASAQDSLFIGTVEARTQSDDVFVASVPPEAQLVELERWIGREVTFSVRPAAPHQTHPGRREGVLGFISFTAFPGSRPLFGCRASDYSDRFTSIDPSCEGHLPMPQIPITGHIAATPLPGTVPLYRCMRVGGLPSGRWGDNFDTTDANCEGKRAVFLGLLGHIWQ